jgi:hypothetical protein
MLGYRGRSSQIVPDYLCTFSEQSPMLSYRPPPVPWPSGDTA